MIGFTAQEKTLLANLQKTLFKSFQYITDTSKHKLREFWEDVQPPKGVLGKQFKFTGDCEEFAMHSLTKVRELGIDARLVACLTEQGEGHCICEVLSKDHKEAMFFDNRYQKTMTRPELKGYTFVVVGPINPVRGDTRKWFLVK